MAVKIQLRRDTSANWTSANPTLSSGEMGVETDTQKVKVGNGSTAWNSLGYVGVSADTTKSISIPSPTSSDIFTLFYTKNSSTLTKIESVLRGSSSPSVSFTIKYGSDRSSGTPVTSSAMTVTSTTTGLATTSFSSGTIPAGNFVWIEVTAVSGTVDELSVSLQF